MYHTTGFTREQIVDLCSMSVERFPHLAVKPGNVGRKRVLGLFKSVVVTLTYLRRNHVQAELGEYHGASQSTISRRVAAFTPILWWNGPPGTPSCSTYPARTPPRPSPTP